MAGTDQEAERPALRHALALLAILSALVWLATFALPIPRTPFAPMDLVAPMAADSNETMCAIGDAGSRLLILNGGYEVTGVVNVARMESPIDAITDLCVSGETIYVAGVRYEPDSAVIARERVVSYDRHGGSERLLIDEATGYDMIPEIKSIDEDGEGGATVIMYHQDLDDTSNSWVEVTRVDREGVVARLENHDDLGNVFDIGYSARSGSYAQLDFSGALCLPDGDPRAQAVKGHIFTSLDLADDDTIYLVDCVDGAVYLLGNEADATLERIANGAGYANLHTDGRSVTMCDRDRGSVSICDLSGRRLKDLSTPLPARWLSWLWTLIIISRIYLSIFVILKLAGKAMSLVRAGKTQGIGPMLVSVVTVSVVALAIGYLSYGSYRARLSIRESEVSSISEYLGNIGHILSADLASLSRWSFVSDQPTEEVRESIASLSGHLEGLTTAMMNHGIGIYVKLYAADEGGIYSLFDTTYGSVWGSSLTSTLQLGNVRKVFETGEETSGIAYVKGVEDTTMQRLIPVYDTSYTQVTGVIEVGCRMRGLEESIANTLLERVIALLVIMLVVYLVYVEVEGCARCFVSYGEMRERSEATAILTRPFSFAVFLLTGIDSVMSPLIARELLDGGAMDDSGILIALPVVMAGTGMALGQLVYSKVGCRASTRAIAVRSALALAAASLVAVGAIAIGAYVPYCVAKFLAGVPLGLLVTIAYSLPRHATSDEVRELADGGVNRTGVSATVLGNLAGGYVAQVLGSAWVYVLAAASATIMLLTVNRLFPMDQPPLEDEANTRTDREAVIGLVRAQTTLPVIFFLMLPAALAAGYNSFLFPLYSANVGISTSSIHNLFVLGQLTVFVSLPALERLEARFDRWYEAIGCVGGVAVVFGLFYLNTSLVWAVVTISLVGICTKASLVYSVMWSRSAASLGLPEGVATGASLATDSVLAIVQPLLLGLLLTWSGSLAVVALGLVCAACALSFYVTTRQTPLAPQRGPR